jgi:hypothetical protein
VVGVTVLEKIEVKRRSTSLSKTTEEFRKHLKRKSLNTTGLREIVVELSPTANIERSSDENFVEGEGYTGVTINPFSLPQRLVERVTKRDTDILNKVVRIHFRVPSTFHPECDTGVFAELFEHVIKERQSCIDSRFIEFVKVYLNLNGSFLGTS